MGRSQLLLLEASRGLPSEKLRDVSLQIQEMLRRGFVRHVHSRKDLSDFLEGYTDHRKRVQEYPILGT